MMICKAACNAINCVCVSVCKCSEYLYAVWSRCKRLLCAMDLYTLTAQRMQPHLVACMRRWQLRMRAVSRFMVTDDKFHFKIQCITPKAGAHQSTQSYQREATIKQLSGVQEAADRSSTVQWRTHLYFVVCLTSITVSNRHLTIA